MKKNPAPTTARRSLKTIFRVAQGMRTILDQELEPLAVTGQQAALMLHCARGLGESFDALAKALGIDSAGVTRLADRLEAKGFLSRKPGATDRRATRLVLSAGGQDLLPAVQRSISRWQNRVLRGVSDAELSQLERPLSRILKNIEPEPDAPR
jgi:DNA-binding MarR family transcriptional regulator